MIKIKTYIVELQKRGCKIGLENGKNIDNADKFWYYKNSRAILIENDKKDNILSMKVYVKGHIHPVVIMKTSAFKIDDLLKCVGIDIRFIQDIKEKLGLINDKKIILDNYAEIHTPQDFEKYLNHGESNFTIL